VRIHITTAGSGDAHVLGGQCFKTLASLDEVGEHRLTPDAREADLILFVDLQQHPDDPFLRVLRRHPLVRSYPWKVAVYDERDLPFYTFPGIYVSGTPGLAARRPAVGGPYPSLPTNIAMSAQRPDLLFSFRGARSHPVRDVVLALNHQRSSVLDTSSVDFFAAPTNALTAARDEARSLYSETVIRSKFVLCPRGHGRSSFRLFETLAAGRVPVIISDDWLAPPGVDWDECAIRVRESEAHSVGEVLERLEPRWPVLAAAASATYSRYFAFPRLWHTYATALASLERSGPERFWWLQPELARLGARQLRNRLRRR
jgi:hypothetical protein